MQSDVAATFAQALALAALLIFALATVKISLTDIKTKTIKNSDLLVFGLAILAFLVSSSLVSNSVVQSLLPALAGAATTFLVLLALAILVPRGLGGGDVKLGFLLGLVIAFFAPFSAIFWALALSFVIGAVWALAQTIAGKKEPDLPFGPAMFIASWVVLVGAFWQGGTIGV